MSKFNLTHARHDTAICLAPALFRSLKRGERKKHKLDVKYAYNEHEELRFIGFEPLDDFDMRVLQGLIATAGMNGAELSFKPQSKIGTILRDLLAPSDKKSSLVVNESLTWLLKEIGLADSGQNIKNLRDSIRRMANVTVIIKNHEKEASCHLLSYVLDDNSGSMHIAINTRLTDAILGGQHTKIDMQEVRKITSAPTRLIHQRLCAWVPKNTPTRITVDRIVEYVWIDPSPSLSAASMRRYRAKKSLLELQNLGWVITEYSKNKFEITRK